MSSFLGGRSLIIKEAKGVILRDIYGNEYIDGVSSLWCNIHGHRKKEIDRAIKAQLKKVAHSTLLGASNIPSIMLAKRLVEIAPKGVGAYCNTPLLKVFYSDNGSTAVEVALKMAFQYWQQSGSHEKKKFLALQYAYHGDTLGAVGVGGIAKFHDIYRPLTFATGSTEPIKSPSSDGRAERDTHTLPSPIKGEGGTYKLPKSDTAQVFFAPSPYCYRCPLDKDKGTCALACLEEMGKILAQNHNEFAALIIESLVQGAGGMIVHPKGYLRGVRELCSKYNVLLIVDEVLTGFGRTGRMFACEQEEVMPDIMCVSKGITGGYLPLAATLTTENIFNAFLGDYSRTFFHGHTYTGNPLACAAALASLEVFEKETVLKKLQPKIECLQERLQDFYRLEHVGDVRQCGLIAGIELVRDREAKEPYPAQEKIGHKVILEARNLGALLRPIGDVIVIMPPLSITLKQLERL
ncbi:MAG TPA: aspartate aminotransferase family protein, partial [Candidatus Hypogeohydataceae bacterium YC41]